MRRFPTIVSFIFVFLLSTTARAQLSTVETPEVQIVYFDGAEAYLVPHVARAFLNALAFERRLFGYDPTQRVTLLLADFSDAGNAARRHGPAQPDGDPDRAAQLRVRDHRRQRAHERPS